MYHLNNRKDINPMDRCLINNNNKRILNNLQFNNTLNNNIRLKVDILHKVILPVAILPVAILLVVIHNNNTNNLKVLFTNSNSAHSINNSRVPINSHQAINSNNNQVLISNDL